MSNPYINLIKTIWRNGKPWRRSIVLFYIAYIIAQAFLSVNPYAFGRAIDALQNFHSGRLHEVIGWLLLGVVLLPLFKPTALRHFGER